jgi:hypothetical protein
MCHHICYACVNLSHCSIGCQYKITIKKFHYRFSLKRNPLRLYYHRF